MIQTAIYSFGASWLTAVWLGDGFLEAGTIASAISALNAALWHIPFFLKVILRRQGKCPECGSTNVLEVTSDLRGCDDCGNVWK